MDNTKPEIPNDLGVIRIADEVISTVAGLAAVDVEGVAAMSGGWGTDLVEKLGKKNLGKGIKVEATGDQTAIDIFIVIEFGYAIPKVCENVHSGKIIMHQGIGMDHFQSAGSGQHAFRIKSRNGSALKDHDGS